MGVEAGGEKPQRDETMIHWEMSYEGALQCLRSVKGKVAKDAESVELEPGPIAIVKAESGEIGKAQTVGEILSMQEAMERFWRLRNALDESLRQILGEDMEEAARTELLSRTVAEFVAATKDILPRLPQPARSGVEKAIAVYSDRFIRRVEIQKGAAETASATLDQLAREHAKKTGKSFHASYAAVARANRALLWAALKESGPIGSTDERPLAKARWV